MVSQVEMQDGRRRPRNRRGQGSLLRDELIQAARQLLMTAEEESDVSIRAVTRAAGAAPQSFYLQFADLDELLYAVYALEFEDLRQVMAAAAAAAPAPFAALLAVCTAYCDYARAHPGRYRLLTGTRGQVHEAWDGQPLPGTPAFTLLKDAIAAVLAERQAGLDPFLAASTMWACLHGLVTLRASRPAFPWPPLEDMVTLLVTHMLAVPSERR
jgi:AcrR family transcriptional regulator